MHPVLSRVIFQLAAYLSSALYSHCITRTSQNKKLSNDGKAIAGDNKKLSNDSKALAGDKKKLENENKVLAEYRDVITKKHSALTTKHKTLQAQAVALQHANAQLHRVNIELQKTNGKERTTFRMALGEAVRLCNHGRSLPKSLTQT